ncbi:PaaI family thioesterase [Thermovenabulum gondwanense]|uniref:Thioesterase domain-containing protein n=1 Tax=Thermovenabulum gondwanense TaxID=520767 RepID=A0A162MWK1_9FIRM|nr:PaaI family thioesterase [Thermovenabulum gondwanense]KYO68026.1 hypothetical protein ATZ99_03370 [Thermovenabulum gondwanense]
MGVINKGLEDEIFRETIENFLSSPFINLMGYRILEIGKGEIAIEYNPGKEMLNALGIIHGGSTAALCDTAMGFAVRSLGKIPTTVEMKINYLFPVNLNDKILARGKVIKEGENICVAECDLIKEDKVVVKSIGTYFNLKK